MTVEVVTTLLIANSEAFKQILTIRVSRSASDLSATNAIGMSPSIQNGKLIPNPYGSISSHVAKRPCRKIM